MTEEKPRLIPTQPWENGWAPDTTRVPGTRRLWMAGTLALSVVAACVTAIVITDRQPEETEPVAKAPAASPGSTYPGLLTFASPSATGTEPPGGKSGLSSSQPTASAATTPDSAPDVKGSASAPVPEAPRTPAASPSPSKSSAAPSTPDRSLLRSVEAVNYPDRYWHVSDGLVKLDQVRGSESRQDSSFSVVKGLANNSCYSFKTHDGKYLRHRNFILRAEGNDGSSLFKQDATFCGGYSGYTGAAVLTSVNYPNYALRHKNFQLRLDPYGYNTTNRQDFYFRVVAPLG
ncbi:AbfB domain-containing protein [Streptomyces turgidiscabies]|uniref:Alpha-L-arabinofuranosidase B (ABFB) n=1 Tax=Streptomyces turgidiscabies (strain Car8) TaxID=698760 RepID=L7ESV4_STRT8|nr:MULTISPECIES: AbfB domain-containing protein [Streptomyces]ELP62503.1 alpha-L-arabinofuranosidase B (ABFB) [Streptomyces turgidiscabies Car8]MDX3498948.1 AbfB domain-containing protein [Streptomyces turgidiscabies]GAQ77422.1 alpha-L-arabinofuranosidase B (ABFB [Streptomyces turgidiscabies]